jgi:hypothetical protein
MYRATCRLNLNSEILRIKAGGIEQYIKRDNNAPTQCIRSRLGRLTMSEILQYLRRTVKSVANKEMTDSELLEEFLTRRSEPAISALVHRHGPMVWGVCRRVLASSHDAEDAFQATFLVLVRKAASILPVKGAVVTNVTNYFLYFDLQCRTDAEGRFVMPDLPFGQHNIRAECGGRGDQEAVDFETDGQECLITMRPSPKPGRKSDVAPANQSPAKPSPQPPAQAIDSWNLAPPPKEPKYHSEPRYALLVFGPQRDTRVWLVLDGTTLYVDRNANGDLTEPGNRLEPNNPNDGSNRFANVRSHTHFDVYEFTVNASAGRPSKLRLEHWIRAEHYEPTTEFEKERHERWKKLRFETTTLCRQDGQGQAKTLLLFMPKSAVAQVCALDGPLTFMPKLPDCQVLQRWEGGCELAFHIAGRGRPPFEREADYFNRLATKEVPKGVHLEVEIEYPAKEAGEPPLRRKHLLKRRC